MQAEVAMIVNDSEGWDSHERWPLTRREREVLRLVATGLRNREIADALGVSVRTVDQHLCSIFNRLGVSSRTAAVARVLGLE
jgi:DNA-binding NarL/FixJ family response regulator